jgi:hypothetical protein
VLRLSRIMSMSNLMIAAFKLGRRTLFMIGDITASALS